jgi:hypothetical protein
MRYSALLFAVLLAVSSVATTAQARHRGHNHHVPTAAEMQWHALAGTLSLFAPIPITILVTKAADDAAAERRRHHRR